MQHQPRSVSPLVAGFAWTFSLGLLALVVAFLVAVQFRGRGVAVSRSRHARIVWRYHGDGFMAGEVWNTGTEPLNHLAVTVYHYEPIYANGFVTGRRKVADRAAVTVDGGFTIPPGSSGGVILGATQGDMSRIGLIAISPGREEPIPFTQEIDPSPLPLAPGSGTIYR